MTALLGYGFSHLLKKNVSSILTGDFFNNKLLHVDTALLINLLK